MVTGSKIGILGAALRRSHGLSAESEVLGLSSRVRRAASSLQMQSEETVLASYGPTKTAILTMLRGSPPPRLMVRRSEGGEARRGPRRGGTELVGGNRGSGMRGGLACLAACSLLGVGVTLSVVPLGTGAA